MSRLTTPYKIAYVPIPILFGIADNFLANCYLQSELNKIDRLIFTLHVKGVRHMMLRPIIISELLTLPDFAPPIITGRCPSPSYYQQELKSN